MDQSMTDETRQKSNLPIDALTILGTGLFGIGVAVGGYGAYVTALIARGVAPSAAGFGMTLFLLGQLIAVLPADLLTRQYGSARVAALGFILAGVGAAVGGYLVLTVVYLSRTLLGFGTGAAFLASVKYAGFQTSRRSRSLVQGLLGATFTLGLTAGLAAGPTILNQYGPMVLALFATIVTVVPAIGAPRLQDTPGKTTQHLEDYFAPFRSSSNIVLGLANMASFGLLIVATTWYGDLLATEPTLPAALILIGFSIATVLGRFGGGWLARVLNERATVAVTLALLCALLICVAVAITLNAPVLLGVALIGTGAGFGLPFGPLFSLVFSNLADDSGVALVTMTAVGNAGALAYPWLVGRLLAVTDSYSFGFVIMALTVALVVMLWIRTIGMSDISESAPNEADTISGKS